MAAVLLSATFHRLKEGGLVGSWRAGQDETANTYVIEVAI
jgi:hypothetical protein